MGANVGATRANDLPRQRTNADKRVAIMPGRELIRTMLNATQVTTDQNAGGSNPSKRASERARSQALPSRAGPSC